MEREGGGEEVVGRGRRKGVGGEGEGFGVLYEVYAQLERQEGGDGEVAERGWEEGVKVEMFYQ